MGYKIAELRKERRMSQLELALKAGVSRATVNGLETGRICVTSSDTLKKIAKALNATISDIFF